MSRAKATETPFGMTDLLNVLATARDRALRVRLDTVRAGARRRVKPYRMLYELDGYKAPKARVAS